MTIEIGKIISKFLISLEEERIVLLDDLRVLLKDESDVIYITQLAREHPAYQEISKLLWERVFELDRLNSEAIYMFGYYAYINSDINTYKKLVEFAKEQALDDEHIDWLHYLDEQKSEDSILLKILNRNPMSIKAWFNLINYYLSHSAPDKARKALEQYLHYLPADEIKKLARNDVTFWRENGLQI